MIGHVLAAAETSGLFDVIHVSTEDCRIQEVVSELGHPVPFSRPAELADDHVGILPVLKDVVETFLERGESFDQVVLLVACAPLIDASDLQKAAQMFDQLEGQYGVMSVGAYPAPVEWAYSRRENGEMVPRNPGQFAVRSQDLETCYYDAGCFVFFSTDKILRELLPDNKGFVGYVLPKWKAVDIDDAEDWTLAESIFNGAGLIRSEPSSM
jgi:pseudaminic acid cytidylyltransferase